MSTLGGEDFRRRVCYVEECVGLEPAGDADRMLRLIDTLPSPYGRVLSYHFGLGEEGPMPLFAVAEKLGISPEGIHGAAHEAMGMLKIASSSEADELETRRRAQAEEILKLADRLADEPLPGDPELVEGIRRAALELRAIRP